MIIYCDGGSKKRNKGSILSWGIRCGDLESFGHLMVKQELANKHELVAFVEAVKFAKASGGNTFNTRIYTDWILLQQTNQFAQTKGITHHTLCRARGTFKGLEAHYDHAVLEEAAQFLIYANVFWVRGHARCVNNLRVDYLARHARSIGNGEAPDFVHYDTWLNNFNSFYTQDGETKEWYVHFSDRNPPTGPAHLMRMAGFTVPALVSVDRPEPKKLSKKKKKAAKMKQLELFSVQA